MLAEEVGCFSVLAGEALHLLNGNLGCLLFDFFTLLHSVDFERVLQKKDAVVRLECAVCVGAGVVVSSNLREFRVILP